MGRKKLDNPTTREGLGKEGWADYMRNYRANHPTEKKRDPNLDRSKPERGSHKQDPGGYHRQDMRHRRDTQKGGQHDE